jgi:hypothetical protein
MRAYKAMTQQRVAPELNANVDNITTNNDETHYSKLVTPSDHLLIPWNHILNHGGACDWSNGRTQ